MMLSSSSLVIACACACAMTLTTVATANDASAVPPEISLAAFGELSLSASDDTPKSRWQARSDKDAVLVGGVRTSPSVAKAGTASLSSEQFRRAPALMCGIDNALQTDLNVVIDCTADVNRPLEQACAPDQRAVDPLFRRVQDASAPGGWGEWQMLDNGCLLSADIAAAVAREFQRLPLAPSALSVQPPSGWTLVNAETVAFADDSIQTLSTSVLGLDVTIRAEPTTFTWTFGDDSAALTTTDPGQPWPNHTIAHRYETEGTHSIGLVTTWSGTFQIAGSPEWAAVDGTATTISTSPPLTVYEARSRLVSGSTD